MLILSNKSKLKCFKLTINKDIRNPLSAIAKTVKTKLDFCSLNIIFKMIYLNKQVHFNLYNNYYLKVVKENIIIEMALPIKPINIIVII